jgi:hypothetical protein
MNLTEIVQRNLVSLKENLAILQLLDAIGGLGPSLILGGAIRDWVFGNRPKDIDIVVDCPANKLTLDDYQSTKSKFGGIKLTVDEIDFDVWSREHSWAFKNEPSLNEGLDTVTQVVFFNADAIGYRLDSDRIVDHGFSSAIDSRILDIIYEPNPFPFLQVSKALILFKKYDLSPSSRLRDYIEEQIARGYARESFIKYQKLNYGDTIYQYDECVKPCQFDVHFSSSL